MYMVSLFKLLLILLNYICKKNGVKIIEDGVSTLNNVFIIYNLMGQLRRFKCFSLNQKKINFGIFIKFNRLLF